MARLVTSSSPSPAGRPASSTTRSAGIIEACRARSDDLRHGLRRPARHRRRAEGRAARPLGPAGRGDRPAAHHAGRRRHRHLPLQAQDGPGRGLRARHRGLQGPRRRLLLLHRRQRLDGHRQQGRQLAHERGLDLVAVGVPKTIDNDVGDSEFKLIDHTPGYGSVARYCAQYVQQANEENAGSCPADPVLVMQAMGRKIGFIPAAARLADPEREMPLQIYLAEVGPDARAARRQRRRPARSATAAASSSSARASTSATSATIRDTFGHVQFSASQTTVAQIVVNYLNTLEASRAGQGPRQGARHRPAQRDRLRQRGRPRRGLRRRPARRRGRPRRRQRLHGHDPPRPRRPVYSVRYDKVPLEQGRQQRAHLPEALDRPEPAST